nr:hypothetical protein [Paraburkholderia aromaticivorans]
MNPAQRSLRLLVEKWLTPTAAAAIRVTRFSRTGFSKRRYVNIEVDRPGGSVSLFFFQHDDGTWQVFPPGNGS